MKVIGEILCFGASIFTGVYLFIKIPIWILLGFGLVEKYANYPAAILYGIELVFIIIIAIIIGCIRQLYLNNLENIKNEEEENSIN